MKIFSRFSLCLGVTGLFFISSCQKDETLWEPRPLLSGFVVNEQGNPVSGTAHVKVYTNAHDYANDEFEVEVLTTDESGYFESEMAMEAEELFLHIWQGNRNNWQQKVSCVAGEGEVEWTIKPTYHDLFIGGHFEYVDYLSDGINSLWEQLDNCAKDDHLYFRRDMIMVEDPGLMRCTELEEINDYDFATSEPAAWPEDANDFILFASDEYEDGAFNQWFGIKGDGSELQLIYDLRSNDPQDPDTLSVTKIYRRI